MTAKFSASRREAFLAALRATGNQTLSAERAKVSRSWVTANRARDAGFDAAVRDAIAGAKRVLRDAAREAQVLRDAACAAPQDCPVSGMKPPSGWGHLDGAELVVKGTGGSALGPTPGGGRRVQIARARVRQWSPRAEERFLAALGATCNVKAACAEVGLTAASAYNHRHRWPGFARRWDAAVETGYTQLECALLESAENLLSGRDVPDPPPLRGMTVDHAIHLVHMHKHAARGIGMAPGKRWQRPKTLEELAPGILRKLETFMQMQERDPAETARRKREWAARAVTAG